MVKLYEIFTGEDLKIAELIQRRRLQVLVHSYIYYEADNNIVSDRQWSEWAVELAGLQRDYPEIEKKVPYREGFEDWDGSTGAFLPLHDPWVIEKANRLMGVSGETKKTTTPPKPIKKQSNPAKKKLF